MSSEKEKKSRDQYFDYMMKIIKEKLQENNEVDDIDENDRMC